MSIDEKKNVWQRPESSKHLRDPHRGPGIEEDLRERAEREAQHPAKDYAPYIVDTIHDALLVLRKDLRIEAANRAFYETFQTSPEETLGRSVFEFMEAQWDTLRLRELLEEVLPENEALVDFEIEQRFEGLGRRVMLFNARRLDNLELILLAIEDVTEARRAMLELEELNEELEERVEKRTAQVRSLARALSEAEEKERERIADVLHDDVQQLLYGAELALRTLRRRADGEVKEERHKLLDQLGEALDEAQQATRTLSVELSPPLQRGEGLALALKWLARHFEERYGLSVRLDLEEDFRLADEALRRFLFQLTRELLFNAVKHAETEEAQVKGRRTEEALLLEVSDEGKGFEREVLEGQPRGRGLHAMEARLELLGGEFSVETAPGKGTRVAVIVPIAAKKKVQRNG